MLQVQRMKDVDKSNKVAQKEVEEDNQRMKQGSNSMAAEF